MRNVGLSDRVAAIPQSVRLQRKAGLPVQIRNFDWHASLKDFRETGTVEALWQVLQPFVPACGMASGSISQSAASEHQNGEHMFQDDDHRAEHVYAIQQC